MVKEPKQKEPAYYPQNIPQITYKRSIDTPKQDKSEELEITVLSKTEKGAMNLFKKVKQEVDK